MNNPQRFRLECSYDGTDYYGWQIQPDVRTVQGRLESVLSDLLGRRIRLHGSGRTDRGVHALGQTAHFKTNTEAVDLPRDRWTPMFNQRLPEDVHVRRIDEVGADFDARHSARSRVYAYRFLHRSSCRFGDRRYAWVLDGRWKPRAARSAAESLSGSVPTRVFSGRGGSTHRAERWTVKLVLRWLRPGDVWVLVRSRSFRYRMVRCLATAVANRLRGRWTQKQLRQRMEEGKSVDAAPAAGCFLIDVRYDPGSDGPRPWNRILRAFKRGGLP